MRSSPRTKIYRFSIVALIVIVHSAWSILHVKKIAIIH